MDTEHRHELKENDLAEFIANFGETWRKYGNLIVTTLLVLVVGFTAVRWLTARAATAKEQAWRDLAETTSPDGFRAVAIANRDPAVRSLAYLRGADQLLARSAAPANRSDNPLAIESTSAMPNDADIENDLNSAAQMYEQVIRDEVPIIYKLNAHMGLAAIAETKRDWEQARDHYESVLALADDTYVNIARRANTRAEMLDRLKELVIFAPDPITTLPAIPNFVDLPAPEGINDGPEAQDNTDAP